MHRMLTILVALSIGGCGPSPPPKRETAPVSGKVAYKGAPLKNGTVTFQPPSGAPEVAEIQSDGTYSLTAVIGPNKVMVVNKPAEAGPPGPDPEQRKAAAAAAAAVDPATIVPPEYGTPATPLKFDVKAGSNTADFDIK